VRAVYECRPSCEDFRPVIDFTRPENLSNDWLTIGEVLDGTRPSAAYPSKVAVTVGYSDATDWDSYLCPGVRGPFSTRFVNLVGADALRTFTLFPVELNGMPYFFLRCDARIDCFDRANAEFEVFQRNPARIKQITRFAFHEWLPKGALLFSIPESRLQLFASKEVALIIEASTLKGIRLVPLTDPNNS